MFLEFEEDKGDDFLNEFRQKLANQPIDNLEEKRNELKKSKSVFIGAVSGMALALVVGWFVLAPTYQANENGEIPTIRRPQQPVKAQPSEPGGMEISNRDKSVYDILEKKETTTSVETVLPPTEELQAPVVESVTETVVETVKVVPVKPEPEIIKPTAAPAPIEQPKQIVDIKTESQKPASISEAVVQEVKAKEEPKVQAKAIEKVDLGTVPAGRWQVQLMASNNKKAVEASWKELSAKYAPLKGQEYEIEMADLGAKGRFYRLKAGNFKDRAGADKLCNDLKALGLSCIVKKK